MNTNLNRAGFVISPRLCYSHFLLRRVLRNKLLFSVVCDAFISGVLESKYCQQMESALNPFSSLLSYQKVIKHCLASVAETLVCYDTAQRKVHLGFFTCCGTRKAIYPHLGHCRFAFQLYKYVWVARPPVVWHGPAVFLSVLKADFIFLFWPTGSSRKHSAARWCLQNIAQESVESSDEEFFDARG